MDIFGSSCMEHPSCARGQERTSTSVHGPSILACQCHTAFYAKNVRIHWVTKLNFHNWCSGTFSSCIRCPTKIRIWRKQTENTSEMRQVAWETITTPKNTNKRCGMSRIIHEVLWGLWNFFKDPAQHWVNYPTYTAEWWLLGDNLTGRSKELHREAVQAECNCCGDLFVESLEHFDSLLSNKLFLLLKKEKKNAQSGCTDVLHMTTTKKKPKKRRCTEQSFQGHQHEQC